MALELEELTAAEETALAGEADAGATQQPAGETETAAAADGATPAAKPAAAAERPTTVPHAALHQEREQHKQTKSELSALRTKFDTLITRVDRVLASREQPGAVAAQPAAKPAKREIPDVAADPLGHLVGRFDELRELVMPLVEGRQQDRAMTDQQRGISAIANRAQVLEREFMAAQPNYAAATTHLQQSRDRQLRALGYGNAEERQSIMQREAFEIGAMAINRGDNPAEVVWNLALAAGYVPPAAADPAAGEAEPDEDAAATAAAAIAAAATGAQPARRPTASAAERVATAARGAGAARSLTGARPGSKPQLNAISLLDMDDAAFDAAMQTPEGRALMGD